MGWGRDGGGTPVKRSYLGASSSPLAIAKVLIQQGHRRVAPCYQPLPRRWPWPTRVVASVMGGCLLCLPWVGLNIEPSVPLGFYRLHAVPPTLEVGDLVVLPVPASMAPWYSRLLLLLKPVAAGAGHSVCHSEHVLFVRGLW